MICERFETCPFYNDKMKVDKGIGLKYKKRYCEGNNKDCARYLVLTTLGKEMVPEKLFPNMTEKAKEIIEKNSK